MTKIRIGIIGGKSHSWVSVDRTRKFYIVELEKHYDLVFAEDVANFHSFDLVLNFSGSEGWINKVARCPTLYCIHGGAILDQTFLIENLQHLTDRDGLIVNCTSDIEVIKSLCVNKSPKLFHLPLPVNEGVFFSIDKSVAKSILEIAEDTICIGMVSRLLPQKNPHVFLQFLYKIRKQTQKRVRAWIVGDFWVDYPVLDYYSEEYPTYIANLVETLNLEDTVSFMPANLTDGELNCFYNAMDFIVHPTNSLDENFGYVPIEAMACGTPVVGALYGGLKDTIKPTVGIGISTFTTENGIRMDFEGALPAIIDLIEHKNPKIRQEACRKNVEKNYSVTAFNENLRHAIASLLESSTHVNTTPIITLKQNKTVKKGDQLPTTSNGIGWNYYKPVVDLYVSSKTPVFEQNDRIYLDCEYAEEAGLFHRNDPAWPAAYRLKYKEREILIACKNRSLTFQEFLVLDLDLKIVQKMIHQGIVIVSKHNAL